MATQLERWPERGRWAHETVGALRDAARVVAALHPDRVGRQVARIAAHLDLPPAEVTAAVVDAVAPEPQPPSPSRYSDPEVIPGLPPSRGSGRTATCSR